MMPLLICGSRRQPGFRSSWEGSTRPLPNASGTLFAGVTGKEGVALRGRKVAPAGPARGKWQSAEAPVPSAQLAERPGGGARGETIKGGSAGEEAPQRQVGARKC